MLGGVVVVLGLLVYQIVQRRRASAALEAVADRFGLGVSASSLSRNPLAEGHTEGRKVEVRTVDSRTGRGSSIATIIRVQMGADVPKDLVLAEESLMTKLHKTLGGRDLEIGVASFDRNMLISADEASESRVRELLGSPANRQFVREFLATPGLASIEEGYARLRLSGYVTDPDRLRRSIEACMECARHVGSGDAPGLRHQHVASSAVESAGAQTT